MSARVGVKHQSCVSAPESLRRPAQPLSVSVTEPGVDAPASDALYSVDEGRILPRLRSGPGACRRGHERTPPLRSTPAPGQRVPFITSEPGVDATPGLRRPEHRADHRYGQAGDARDLSLVHASALGRCASA
jgi:hypothetical protein